MGPLHTMTAREMAHAIAAHELTPTDLLDSCIERIAAVEPTIRAWSFLDIEGARAQARHLTEEAHAGRRLGPLHGVPIGIKDQFDVVGMPTGMRGLGHSPEPRDATAVLRLRQAGAVIVGKLHMPLRGILPPTRNPWNPEHTPGGTSSGTGAAVAARMVPIGLAEQTVGSALRPAAFCGVSALKPTYGRISRVGCYPSSLSMDHPSIIASTISDIALVLSVIGGHDPADPQSLRDDPSPADLRSESLASPRIGLVDNFFPERTEPAMREAVTNAAVRLAHAGARVSTVHLPEDFGDVWAVQTVIFRSEDAVLYMDTASDDPGILGPEQLERVIGGSLPLAYYLQAQRVRRHIFQLVARTLEEVDVLLMAATPGAAPMRLESTGDYSLLSPWSLLGLPAVTINAGLSPGGLPLGLQLVAPAGMDYELMQVAEWSENVLGRLPFPPLLSGESSRTPVIATSVQ